MVSSGLEPVTGEIGVAASAMVGSGSTEDNKQCETRQFWRLKGWIVGYQENRMLLKRKDLIKNATKYTEHKVGKIKKHSLDLGPTVDHSLGNRV